MSFDRDRESLVIEVRFQDGSTDRRVRTYGDVVDATPHGVDVDIGAIGEGPPDWAQNALKTWPTPQAPISFTMDCAPGHEDEAREWLDRVLPKRCSRTSPQ